MTDIEKLKELESDLFDGSTNYESGSKEMTATIDNLQKVHQMEMELEKYEDDRFDAERKLSLEESKVEWAACNENNRTENEKSKNKWEARIKITGLLLFAFGTGVLVKENEVRPAIKQWANTVKAFLPKWF